MCGIIGIISEENVDIGFFNKLLAATMDRGEDATGIWSREVGVIKEGIHAIDFIHKYRKDYSVPTKMIIGHCRKSSGTTAVNNHNNHPFQDDRGILIHNGDVRRMDKIKEYTYKGFCDSEILLSYITTYGINRGLEMLDGNAAIAYIDKSNLDELFMWRYNNPLYVALNVKTKTLVFASTDDIINDNLPSVYGLFTTPGWVVKKLPEYTLYKMGLNNGKLYVENTAFIKPEKDYSHWGRHGV